MQHLVIIGAGFAGFWSAMSAVRQARELGESDKLEIMLITKDEFHSIRPRFYEENLNGLRVPLKNYFDPLGIKLVVGEIAMIDPENNLIVLENSCEKITYNYMILASGSKLKTGDIPGIERAFSVDTFEDAKNFDRHIHNLIATDFSTQESKTFVIVGGGFTGLEMATALPHRLNKLFTIEAKKPNLIFILVDRSTKLASNYSADAQQYILDQLIISHIILMSGEELRSIEAGKVTLKTGKSINADTVVLTTGLEASSLTTYFKEKRDILGRLFVDNFLRLSSYNNVFVAGDVAKVLVDNQNYAVMSCQHAIPQGKFAGHNAVNLMFGKDLIPYSQPRYITCLDLGGGNSLLTDGWERSIQMIGSDAKTMKDEIVTQWIYPAVDVEETIKMSSPVTRQS